MSGESRIARAIDVYGKRDKHDTRKLNLRIHIMVVGSHSFALLIFVEVDLALLPVGHTHSYSLEP